MPTGAKEPEQGDPVEGEREIARNDLVLVKVRYKNIAALEQDEAYEVSATLQPRSIAGSYRDADRDLQWAIGVSAFAEILKQSPYADIEHLDTIQGIVEEQGSRDADRTEFLELFTGARMLMK